MADPLPSGFYYFFVFVEPLLTLAGSASAVFDPIAYQHDLLPFHLAPELKGVPHLSGTMAVRQLGSCFFLFAIFGLVLLRTACATLREQPALLRRVLRAYFGCLAAADLTHVGLTLWDLGYEGATDWRRWNVLIWGNVGITVVLFATRTAWYFLHGRGASAVKELEAKRK